MPDEDGLLGKQAPDFLLPTADKREVALSDIVSRGPAIVWFSRGLGCPICRRHRAQFTLGYPTLQEIGAEILEVTPTPVERASFYFANYALAFPYLCDPSRETALAYGVEHQPFTNWMRVKMMLNDPLGVPELMRSMREGPDPSPEEGAAMTAQDGFFVIDRSGTVREARVGNLIGMPSRAEVERMVREAAG
jgi:peroxiredoxin